MWIPLLSPPGIPGEKFHSLNLLSMQKYSKFIHYKHLAVDSLNADLEMEDFSPPNTDFFPCVLNADLKTKGMENRYQTSWKGTYSR